MKKVLIILILSLATVDGYSQGGLGFGMGMHIPLNSNSSTARSHRIESQVQKMKNDLGLDNDQVVKMRGLFVEWDRRHNGSNPMAPKEFNQRLQQILTPEQFNRLAELRDQKRSQKQQNSRPKSAENNNQSATQKDDWDDVYK